MKDGGSHTPLYYLANEYKRRDGETVVRALVQAGADVDAVKFTQVLRGYKTSEVDWVLDRLGAELDQLRGELAAVRASAGLDRRAVTHHAADEEPV